MGCTRYNSYRLPSVEINDQWAITMQPYWTTFQQHFKEKNVPIWRRRKCSSIKTMHEFTRARHRWPNSMSSARNCFPIQPDLVTISCFQTWRNSLEEKDSSPESSSSPKQTLILKSWTNRIIRTWKSSRIIGSSVSSWKETMLWEIKMNRSKKKCVLPCFSKNLLTCSRIVRFMKRQSGHCDFCEKMIRHAFVPWILVILIESFLKFTVDEGSR